MKLKQLYKNVALLAVPLMIMACGSSSTTTSSSTTSTSFPQGLALASPTASSSSSSSISLPLSVSDLSLSTVSSAATFSEKAAIYATILDAASDAVCQVELPDITEPTTSPDCYGPELEYENHPDASVDSPSGTLPTGDLGLWTSEASNNEACSAAKVNQLLDTASLNTDYVMLLGASMNCLMTRAGTAVPTTDGDSVDLTSELNTAIQTNNNTITVTSATVTNLADITDTDSTARDALLYTFTTEIVDGSTTTTVTSNMKHMPTATDNSTYKGKIWTQQVDDASGDPEAYTVKYEYASSTELNMQVISAAFPSSVSTFFDSDGDLDVTAGWNASMTNAIINLDPSTNYGDMSYAWQAGSGDDNARIFNVYTDATGGCGFFGFGDDFDTSTGALSDNTIDGFVCNWAGPDNDHSMASSSGLAQKQCMTYNSSTGIYEVDTSFENITYAPTNDCDSSGSLGIRLSSASAFDTTSITNDLVTLSSDSEFSSYTAPTEPDLPSSF